MKPGQVSHVFVVDPGVAVEQTELERIAPGLQAQLREDLAPEYGCGENDIVRTDVATVPVAHGEVEIQLHEDAPADQEGALALHFRKDDGTPIIHVFWGLLRRFGVSLSSATSHELLEARVDPDLNECVQLPDGRIAAKEICDQVEGTSYDKLGVEVSNFNTRANWNPPPNANESTKYDFLGKQVGPFQVLEGGYAQVFDPHAGWQQLSANMGAANLRVYHAELERLSHALGVPLTRRARRAHKHGHRLNG